jgi:hypothetical protein
MGALVPIFTAASVAATVIWLVVRVVNRQPFAVGVIALVPLLAISALLGDQRGEFLATFMRVLPWLFMTGGTIGLVCSAFVYQAYVDSVSRMFRSQRFCRWVSRACGPDWVERLQSEWKKWEVVTPRHTRVNMCGSLLFIVAGAVWMVLS